MKPVTLPLCFFIFLFFFNSLYAQSLTVYTEEFPPYNYMANGVITGMSTEVVEAVLKQAEIAYDIKSYPWIRTYNNAVNGTNALIYSISRRAKREKQFQWIGVIVPSIQSVFALKERGDITIKSMNDLKKYQIGTTIGDARETYLINKGFDLKTFQRISGEDSYVRNYKKLKSGRIEVWPIPDAVAFYIANNAGDDPARILQKVYELSDISKDGYYLAASLDTSDIIIGKIKKALEKFGTTPDYRNILKKYGLEIEK